jgi:hypothetical protein
MTEQPVETEQQFLGNETTRPMSGVEAEILSGVGEKYADLIQPRQNYAPNAHRFRYPPAAQEDPAKAQITGVTDLQIEAETHAGHAVRSLENGELDAGIAWLQSALAFAQNARHTREAAAAPRDFSIFGGAL